MNLILLGAPGAGKGTQGALLSEQYGIVRIATGDLLRDAVRRGTPLGLTAKAYMDAGELVPDAIILDLAREAITADSGSDGSGAAEEGTGGRGFILDGFPRTVEQARGLDEMLAELGRPLDAVVVIDVPADVLVKRLSGRRLCPNCGAVYNVYFEPPHEPGVCDACGGALVERADDDAATVRRRLEVYREQTAPVIAHYEASDTPVRYVDGNGSVEQVNLAVRKALES